MAKDDNGKYTDTRKFGFGKDQCKADNGKGRQCSLTKGHDGLHEHWQFPEDVTEEDLTNGCIYPKSGNSNKEPHEPWELGMRIRTWGD